MHDEESLVRRAQKRDPAALSRLYEEYFDRVYRYIMVRVREQTEAEDLTEQVFLKVLQSISSFKWRGVPFSAWLFRIARNLVTDHRRMAARRREIPWDESTATGSLDPVLLSEQRSTVDQLFLAMKQLTQAQREVVELRFVAGLSIAQVAEVLGKSQGAVKALQHSALVALRKKLDLGSGHG